MQRRNFLAAASGPFLGNVIGANDRIRLGQIGLGARGYYELTICQKDPKVEIAAVCDPFQPFVDHAVKQVGGRAEGYQDFRRVLDRKDIDGVFVSTPDHWHAAIAIRACMAGKDVYCEKPLTHRINEGRAMVNAARKYGRVVQTGSQQRSAPHYAKVQELVQSGYIGKVSLVECWNTANVWPDGCGDPADSAAPQGLDWDLYLGPAPKRAYNRNRYIWNWRWFWDYGNGMMTDWGAHHLDSAHQIMGVDAPASVFSAGGKVALTDNRETPDFFRATYEYPGFVLCYTSSMVNATPYSGRSYGIRFHGTKGTIVVDRSSYEVIPEFTRPFYVEGDAVAGMLAERGLGPKPENKRNRQPLCEPLSAKGIQLDPAIQIVHVENWLECIRTRKQTVADWEVGHRSNTACLLGVIAQRTGRKIRWDAKQERITGDDEAAKLMTKEYRSPWALPKV
jgi:predicted dehydrogenase